MKRISLIVASLMLAVCAAIPASAQFRIGPRLGMQVNSLHFNQDLFDSNNRYGFTGGLQVEFMIPSVQFGLDASVMYVRRNSQFMAEYAGQSGEVVDVNREYIDIPINLKWKIGVPLIGSFVKPYVFTGPDFAFLTSRKAISEAWRSKKFDVAWNFGFGLEFLKHLQIGASYGLGMSKAAELVGATSGKQDIEGKNRFWTVTAAYLF